MANKKIKIIIVDDDPDDLEIFQDAIRKYAGEAEISSFINGKAFLEVLEQSKDNELPDLVILDYNMPVFTGFDLLQKLRSNDRFKEIVTVILSTSKNPPTKHECLNCGASFYFSKPDTYDKILGLAEEFIRFVGNKKSEKQSENARS